MKKLLPLIMLVGSMHMIAMNRKHVFERGVEKRDPESSAMVHSEGHTSHASLDVAAESDGDRPDTASVGYHLLANDAAQQIGPMSKTVERIDAMAKRAELIVGAIAARCPGKTGTDEDNLATCGDLRAHGAHMAAATLALRDEIATYHKKASMPLPLTWMQRLTDPYFWGMAGVTSATLMAQYLSWAYASSPCAPCAPCS